MNSDPAVTISEVGPRDGLQIEAAFVPTAAKIALIDALSRTGLPRIEATSFAHPRIVPQMADAEVVLRGITRAPGVRYAALAPNAKGAERAIGAGVDELKIGIAASDTFNELNIGRPTTAGMADLDTIAALAARSGTGILGVVATAFGCPYEGEVPMEKVHALFEQLVGFEADVIYLADTTGMAHPLQVQQLVGELLGRWPAQRIGLHLHNTRGLGIANALAGLEVGVRDFESSIGGLGGCPFAPRAAGNISTEDFVHMLHQSGFSTGIDLPLLIAAAEQAQELLGRTLPGMVMKAGPASTRFARGAALKLD
jgi:hydroxymethylglutaryl-CoA lyase